MGNLKEKIKHFSKGDFQLKRPKVIFRETHLSLKIGEGELYSGNFIIENENDGDIRGLIYPSSIRMQCKEQGFQGNPVRIEFTYDGRGLEPGHVEKGSFAIVCNGGEYEVGFSAIIEKPFVVTSEGKIQDLRGFKKLAFNRFDEAVKIFRSRDFYELIKYEEPRIKHLYDNMRKWNLDSHGMEEFLVGIKQKEKIFLTLNRKERSYKNLDEVIKDTLIITKNTWGFLEVKVETDCDFIELEQIEFTTRDFNGKNLEYSYTINPQKLHAGINYGVISFKTPYRQLDFVIDVEIEKDEVEDKRHADYIMAHLLKNYLKYEGGHVQTEKWLHESLKQIIELQELEPSNEEYRLIQAHIYILARKKEDAKWIIENYNYSKFAIGRNIELDAYYLYLMSIYKHEFSYTKKVVEELQKCYLKHAKSWKILCMLIDLDPYYNDYFERKHALENQFNLGAKNLIFYFEALKCFRDKCSNLKKLGNFEIQVLNFAIKYKLITNELALYTANLASQQKEFDKRVFKILEQSYELYDDVMILNAICTILIKGNLTDDRYFKWYELAVQEELKIAKLFEYYMESINVSKFTGELPRTVLLYFAHGNTLPYEKAALLYANVIKSEKNTTDLYLYYKEEMHVFMHQQLELRRINHNLRIIYKALLDEKEMNISKIQAIFDVTHTFILTTQMPDIKQVMVISPNGEINQCVPYTDEGAQIILSSKDELIVWEGKNGTHYIGSVKYKTERLFYDIKYMDMCNKYLNSSNEVQDSKEEIILTYEKLEEFGPENFDESSVYLLCKSKLKEEPEKEDEFLLHNLFVAFQNEMYDKATLSYLARYYCGATKHMKELWYAAKDFEIDVAGLSERIITQMVFSETMYAEDEIFEAYYESGAYFRLKEAFLVYVCHEYVVKERVLSENIVAIVMKELEASKAFPDVIKIAMLKYFAFHPFEESYVPTLKYCLQLLCEKQMYFTFYMKYGKEWLREVQLWDKTLISYTSQIGGKVKLIYQLQTNSGEVIEYNKEILLPMYEGIYVKRFLIFQDEVLQYYFVETLGDQVVKSSKYTYKLENKTGRSGKYGKLNEMIRNSESRNEKMVEYALEEAIAERIFVPYE